MSDTTVPYLKWGVYVIVAVAIVIGYQFLPVDAWTTSFRTWVEDLGPSGWIITIFVYALATVALVPGAILTIACGLAFGLYGFFIVAIGATLGACLAFLIARYFLQDTVEKRVAKSKKFKAVYQAIDDEGWKVVGLMRLSPAVPFSLQNWFFGATSVGFWPYAITTFFGIMPGTLLYVWIGSLGGSAAAEGDTSTAKYIMFGVGLVATLIVTVLISRKAKSKLKAQGIEDE